MKNSASNLGRDAKAHIQAELKRIGKLPPTGLSLLLEPYTEPLRQIFETLQLAQQAWVTWIDQSREKLAAIQQVFEYAAMKAAEFAGAADSASKGFAIRGPVRKRTIKHAKEFSSLFTRSFPGRKALTET